jgi:hypothetical protein
MIASVAPHLAHLGLILGVPVVVAVVLSRHRTARAGDRPQTDAARARDAMYRTSFGFTPQSPIGDAIIDPRPAAPYRAARRQPFVFAIALLPFAASVAFSASTTNHVRELWLFSCRLFGH